MDTKLHIMQKKIVRIITRSKFNAHTDPLYKKLKIFNIYQLYYYFTAIFVYKSVTRSNPKMFWNIFVHNKTSRNALDLRSNFCTRK